MDEHIEENKKKRIGKFCNWVIWPRHEMLFAKKLQAKMVEDGWTVNINHGAKNNFFKEEHFSASAHTTIEVDKHTQAIGEHREVYYMKTEAEAIVELFCKIYGVK